MIRLKSHEINTLYWLGAVDTDIFSVKRLGSIFLLMYASDHLQYHLEVSKKLPRFAIRVCKCPCCHGVHIDEALTMDGFDETAGFK